MRKVSQENKADKQLEESLSRSVLKYFLHGILFSIIFLVLALALAFSMMVLVATGLFIGFIIAFLVLFFILGGLNSFLTLVIWNISTRTGWMSLLGHGFVLFILLTIAHIPARAINLAMPDLATLIVLFIVHAFIDGFVAKNVARWWED